MPSSFSRRRRNYPHNCAATPERDRPGIMTRRAVRAEASYPAFAGWSGDFERSCDGSGLKFRSLRGDGMEHQWGTRRVKQTTAL